MTGKVRDNGDLELRAGRPHPARRLRRGPGEAVTGEGAKRIAQVQFDTAGRKKLLVKIAPIEKI